MDSRKGKKTRSYGEAQKGLRPSASITRPSIKERMHSAPAVQVSQVLRDQYDERQFSITSSSSSRPHALHHNESDPGSSLSAQSSRPTGSHASVQKTGKPSDGSPTTHLTTHPTTSLPRLNFAVVGAAKSGKTTFIHYALDLKKPAGSAISCKKMSLEGEIFVISLIEVCIDHLEVTENQEIRWPRCLEPEKETPHIDGVLALCDIMDRNSIVCIRDLLNACSAHGTPCVLVSCKCDNPRNVWQIDPRMLEKACSAMPGIESFQTTIKSPETHKRCISSILRKTISEKPSLKMLPSANRQRASTSSFPSQDPGTRRSVNTKVKHGRAASEITGSFSRNDTSKSPRTRSSVSTTISETLTSSARGSKMAESPDPSSPSSPSPVVRQSSAWKEPIVESDDRLLRTGPPSDLDPNTLKPRLPAALDTRTIVANSFLEIRDVDGKEDTISAGVLSPLPESSYLLESNTKESGMFFEELVDRLLSLPMSKADAKFAAVFLCLYRKFAAPAELLAAIISQFEEVDESDDPVITCIEAQLRHLSILGQWVSEYPGDFAHPLTRQCMTSFIADLAGTREFAFAAKEIDAHMEGVSQDDDTEWACSDFARGRAKTLESFNSLSVASTGSSTTITEETPPYSGKDSQHWNYEEEEIKERYIRHSKSQSTSSSIGIGSHTLIPVNSVEAAQRQIQLLNPISRNLLTKIQWHQFMDTPDEDIARELTRIDWLMFSSIRPRDLVRHVSLTSTERDKCKGLEYVSRMINHFNHVAFWVANMVLLRDKPKHRAKALEKFMGLAWKLRQMNNYNSLGAVTAGINGTAVYRLSQTRDLVSPQVQKDFMRLEILMSTHKSHFAYRLAWDNTTSERIPFLPLHRRDLVSAEEGNKTFIGAKGDRINWKKFEIMGDVIIGIQKSQRTPYPGLGGRNKEVEKLVLDTKFSKDDDELYERSIQVEPSGAGESYRKKFNWFQR